jgi:hypothetical protein
LIGLIVSTRLFHTPRIDVEDNQKKVFGTLPHTYIAMGRYFASKEVGLLYYSVDEFVVDVKYSYYL